MKKKKRKKSEIEIKVTEDDDGECPNCGATLSEIIDISGTSQLECPQCGYSR